MTIISGSRRLGARDNRATNRACAAVGAVTIAALLVSTAQAQTITGTYGTPTPNYNLNTSILGANVDVQALNDKIHSIAGDITLTADQKNDAISTAVHDATNVPGATCAQQLDPIVSGLSIGSDAASIAGDIGEAVGAAGGVADFEIPGIVIQTVGDGLGLAADITSTVASTYPNCSAEFTGTILADANIASSQGISAFNGAINLGNSDGVTYQAGIAIGGGSVSGAGTLGHEAQTGSGSAIAIGNDSVATSDQSTVLGDAAKAQDIGATAIGAKASATDYRSVAVGYNASATALRATSLGPDAAATGSSSTAVGDSSSASQSRATAVGATSRASGDSSTALGAFAFALGDESTSVGAVSEAGGNQSTALGSHAYTLADQGVAVGYRAHTADVGAMALGTNAQALAQGSVAIGQDSVAKDANTVSLGNDSLQRRITNMAAGIDPTDGVNVSQLQALQGSTDAQFGALNATVDINTATIGQIINGTAGQVQVNNSVNAPAPQATGTNSLAEGPGAIASAASSTAMGIQAIAMATNSTAIGPNASATAENSTAIGPDARAIAADSITIGFNSTVLEAESTVIGNDAAAQARGTTVIGYQAAASGQNSVVLGANSTDGGQSNVVSVGSPDEMRRVINVADATDPHDAVNLNQLVAASTKTLGLANSYTDFRAGQLATAIDRVDRNANAATASAMAVAAIPQSFERGKGMIGIGTGTWDGESAFALGGSMATADGRFVLKIGGTVNTRGKAGGSAGAGIAF
jgi:trimeric autotransporter adhesin